MVIFAHGQAELQVRAQRETPHFVRHSRKTCTPTSLALPPAPVAVSQLSLFQILIL